MVVAGRAPAGRVAEHAEPQRIFFDDVTAEIAPIRPAQFHANSVTSSFVTTVSHISSMPDASITSCEASVDNDDVTFGGSPLKYILVEFEKLKQVLKFCPTCGERIIERKWKH